MALPAQPAALVTGASSGIGFAIADMLGEEGYGLTIAARRAAKLDAAHELLSGKGFEVQRFAGDLGDPDHIRAVVEGHSGQFGRLDVLVNNAGMGISGRAGEVTDRDIALQMRTNLESIIFFYREALPLLLASGAEHGRALVVNMASMSGKEAEAGLGVYSATKYGVVGYTEAMNRELAPLGVRSTALCPGLVDTPMTDFLKDQIPAESMIQTRDISEAVRYLLRTSRGCLIPEVQIQQPDPPRLELAALS
jgi:NAD(P)-dependent dehydrogenase (short-subunit alcohol dehydrogenase family)